MPKRNFQVSRLNQAIYDKLVELGHITPDGKLKATDASRAIFGEVRRQLVDSWVTSGRGPHLDSEIQAILARFLDIPPREVLELAGFDTSDGYGSATPDYLRAA